MRYACVVVPNGQDSAIPDSKPAAMVVPRDVTIYHVYIYISTLYIPPSPSATVASSGKSINNAFRVGEANINIIDAKARNYLLPVIPGHEGPTQGERTP
jgi:hypothetical protein